VVFNLLKIKLNPREDHETSYDRHQFILLGK